jgi:hypothetical protein
MSPSAPNSVTTLASQLASVSAALIAAPDFDSAMRAVDAGRGAILGRGYLTVNVDATPPGSGEEMWLSRLWSAVPDQYPVTGRKRKLPSPWTQHVLKECRVLVSEGDDAIETHFDDHAQMKSMGIHLVANYPIAVNGKYAATVNLTSEHSNWSAAQVSCGHVLALLAQPWILRELGFV